MEEPVEENVGEDVKMKRREKYEGLGRSGMEESRMMRKV